MNPVFEFTFSEAILIEMFRRYRRCQKLRRYAAFLKVVLGFFLIALIAVCVLAKTYLGASVIAVFFALLVFAQRLDEWMIGRRFRKSPYRDERLKIQLSPEGFAVRGTITSAQLTWAAFTGARRFADGFLLYQGPGVFNWLPFGAIVEGTVDEAEALIRAHISGYERA